MRSGSAQNPNGSLAGATFTTKTLVLNGLPASWQLLTVQHPLSLSDNFLEYEVFGLNATIPASGFMADQADLRLLTPGCAAP